MPFNKVSLRPVSEPKEQGPKVYNKHHKDAPADAVYIGRGSLWGNRYTHLKSSYPGTVQVDSREEAVRLFEEEIRSNPQNILDIINDLKGKNLVCFCAPLACHGDVLLKIANQE